MSASVSPARPERLVGFDDVGEVFSIEGRVLRGIYPGRAAGVRAVLRACENAGLFEEGLIEAREIEPGPYAGLGYEMIIEHPRIPFVTHPHEWSASMFRDAAVFHIDLFEKLSRHGLTLKDWHPSNILFRGSRPVFVDFASVVRAEDLPRQPHLAPHHSRGIRTTGWDAASRAVYQMYRLMFEPYIGLPLTMMEHGRHAEARRRIYETTLNTGDDIISRREAFLGDLPGRMLYELEERLRRRTLAQKGTVKSRFFGSLRQSVVRKKVAVRGSAYSSYYHDKDEVFPLSPDSRWTAKQHGVHSALTRFTPRTVLDLGCNTGWFSILAAKSGSSVVAVDLDEASVDNLYLSAASERLDILPLVANLTDPLPELLPRIFEDEPSLSLLGEGSPLVTQVNTRLRAEMVLALAVTHHLSLGQGLDFGRIAAILNGLAEKHLCVEFISLEDEMIRSDRSFFPAYAADPVKFGWYSEETFIGALKRYFSAVDVIESYPATRRLLVCSR